MAEINKKTQGDIETAARDGLDRFAREYLGWVPASTRAYLRHDLLLVRLKGGMSVAEVRLLATPVRGRELVKKMRTDLVELARPILATLVEEITGVAMVSLHHDLSTATGEEMFIFILAQAPVPTLRK